MADTAKGLTRSTKQQATELLTRFQILHQWSDNPKRTTNVLRGEPGYLELNGQQIFANTGLSATLIKNIDPSSPYFGTYTLAVRSTEYRAAADGGDGERDKTGADAGEILSTGLALAQLDALDRYYEWLKITPGMLPPGADLYLSGYSLSGHLVTVFTEMHPEVLHAYAFNGAGRGDWDHSRGDLTTILAFYRAVLDDPHAAESLLTSEAGPALLSKYRLALGATGPHDPVSIYEDPRYQWALQATTLQFNLVGNGSFFPTTDPNRVGLTNGADERVTQIYGHAQNGDPEYVANSGIHAQGQSVFIEDQPDIENFVLWDMLGLLGDFGTTHSITLLGDSLALMRLIARMDPQITKDQLGAIFAAASNQRAKGFIAYAGESEGDSLEQVLAALAKVLDVSIEEMQIDRAGNGFANIRNRNIFFENLHALQEEVTTGNYSFSATSTMSRDQLVAAALSPTGDPLPYRYALRELNPFVVLGADYSVHNIDGALELYDSMTRNGTLTRAWLTDRAAFLAWANIANLNDAKFVRNDNGDLKAAENWRFTDLPRNYFVDVREPLNK